MQHRCERGSRCPSNETLEDGTVVGRGINASRGLCEDCERHTEQAIAALPQDYTVLNTMLGTASQFDLQSPVRMSKDPPAPMRLAIQAVQRDMLAEISVWAEAVAEITRVDWATSGAVRDGWLLDRSARLLTGSLSALLALRDVRHARWERGHRYVACRDGLDGALELVRLHHKARAHAGQTTLVHRLPVPCPRCEDMGLRRVDGSETIECHSCTRAYTWDEYEKLCLILTGRRTAGV